LIINNNYYHSGSSVAGPCDFYEQVFNQKDKPVDTNSRCVGGKVATKNKMYAENTSLRSAAIIKTCILLTQKKSLLQTSYAKQKPSVELAYRHFYPFNGGEEYFDLIKMSKEKTLIKEYKKAMLSFCLTPNWQRP
jgi:hypothetical protein